MEAQDQQLNIGEPLFAWDIHEYPNHERSRSWFIIAGILGVALIIYAVVTANFLFAVIILMLGVITMISAYKTPDQLKIILTTTGIILGDIYYDFELVKDFSIAYEPPEIKILYIDFHSTLQPMLSIPLEDTDPNELRNELLQVIPENLYRTEETLTDMVRRLYKL